MIKVEYFVDLLLAQRASFFTGVPDSLLGVLPFELDRRMPDAHVVAANEGSAIGLAIGAFAATGSVPVVYMQNSGLGNAFNPLCSLAHPEIFGVPMLLVIGWRADIADDGVQRHDEPQHSVQGRITQGMLDLLDIPFKVLRDEEETAREDVAELFGIARAERKPVALLVRKGTLVQKTQASGLTKPKSCAPTREEAIEACLDALPPHFSIVATTGMAARELAEIRARRGNLHPADLLVVGGMGHASQIAVGACLANPKRRFACIDGDGAFVMHMGAAVHARRARGFIHIVVNNQVHDSVGGAFSAGRGISLAGIAYACGYVHVIRVVSSSALSDALHRYSDVAEPVFVEVMCRPGSRSDLGRPSAPPWQNMNQFMCGHVKT